MNKEYTLGAIDIGSNAARLQIKHIVENADGSVKSEKLIFHRYPIRLGDDVFVTGRIGSEKKEKMLHMIKGYKQLMKLYNTDEYRVCATSAMREAKNGKEIIKMIAKETGVKIEVINGKEEAALLYDNPTEQICPNLSTCAYVDVGGGSTEITFIKDGNIVSTNSFNIGTLRMIHGTEENNTAAIEQLRKDVSEISTEMEMGETAIVGFGGNINKLYKIAMEKKKKEGRMTIAALSTLYHQLCPLSLEERMDQFALRRDRADVIVPAAEIFLTLAEVLKSTHIYVPILGLTDGLINEMFTKKRKKNLPKVKTEKEETEKAEKPEPLSTEKENPT